MCVFKPNHCSHFASHTGSKIIYVRPHQLLRSGFKDIPSDSNMAPERKKLDYKLRPRVPKEVKQEEQQPPDVSASRKRKEPPKDESESEEYFSSEDEDFDVDAARRARNRHRSRAASRSSSQSSVDSDVDYEIIERQTTSTLADLGGLPHVKQQIVDQVIRPFACPRQARLLKMQAPRGILLSGKPGTGKTVLADAIVSEIRALGRNVKYYTESGTCLSKYLGETESRIRNVFRLARENQPAVIFLDEFDGLGRSRVGCTRAMTTVVTTLLTQLGEVQQGEVLVIAATNHKSSVDSALIRRGRFDLTFNLPLPDLQGRREILRMYQRKCNQEMDKGDLKDLARRTEKFSGSDLEALVRTIHANVIQRVFPNGLWCQLSSKELKRRLRAYSQAMKVQMEHDVDPVLDSFLDELVDEEEHPSDLEVDE